MEIIKNKETEIMKTTKKETVIEITRESYEEWLKKYEAGKAIRKAIREASKKASKKGGKKCKK